MNRRKAAIFLGMVPLLEVSESHRLLQAIAEGRRCLHCVVVRVNEEEAECVVCDKRLRHKSTAALSLCYYGHEEGGGPRLP